MYILLTSFNISIYVNEHTQANITNLKYFWTQFIPYIYLFINCSPLSKFLTHFTTTATQNNSTLNQLVIAGIFMVIFIKRNKYSLLYLIFSLKLRLFLFERLVQYLLRRYFSYMYIEFYFYFINRYYIFDLRTRYFQV